MMSRVGATTAAPAARMPDETAAPYPLVWRNTVLHAIL